MDVFDQLRAFIERNEKIILTAHETPDGDAIGSEVAMLHALRKTGKTVEIINADPTSRKYRFLDPEEEIHVVRREDDLSQPLDGQIGRASCRERV